MIGHQSAVIKMTKNMEYAWVISADKSGSVIFWNEKFENFK